MAKPKTPKESEETGTTEVESVEATEPTPVQATAIPQDVTVPVEGAAAVEVAEKKPAKPAKPEVPEHLKKGNRVCASCLTTEAEFLAKNPRYSLCQGVDVLCYRKGDRVVYDQTMEQLEAKFPDKVGKANDKGQPMLSAVSGMGIKPGILVRGAIKYSRKATDASVPTAAQTADTATPVEATATATPVSTAAVNAPGSSGTTSAG
jgi:hypothetical protein